MVKYIKQRVKSKTFNFGMLINMAGLIQLYLEQMGYGLATLIVGLIIIWLREQTKQPIDEK
jgi:TM2 domain-containing membrane protein YozV